MRIRTLVIGLTFALALVAEGVGAESKPALELSQRISLPGVKGRIDHLAFASESDRLFICARGNNSVEVVDLRDGKRVHSISGLGAPQAIAYVPKPERLYVATDENGSVKVYDPASFRLLAELNLKDDADNMRYEPAANRIYVGFGNGGIAIINAADGKQTGVVQLKGHPEAFELENRGEHIFVNLPTSRQVAVIDRVKSRVTDSWSPGSASGNFPLTLDEASHRLMIGCRSPAKLVVLDSESGRLVAELRIAGDADDLFFDPQRRRMYAICGAGRVEVIQQLNANSYELSDGIETAAGARTGLLVPERNILFVAIPAHGAEAAEVRVYHLK